MALTAKTAQTAPTASPPQLRINSTTNIWEVSYDSGNSWFSLGVAATGADGANGADGKDGKDGTNGTNGVNGQDGTNGITPQLRINSTTNIWEVSYDSGNSWFSLGVAATGANGADGKDGANGTDGKDGANGTDGKDGANGADGKDGADGADGRSAYEIYCALYGYTGTETQWMEELLAGALVKHTVTFDLNDGTAGEGYVETLTASHRSTIALTIPTREGYTFLGWYTGETVVDGVFTTTSIVDKDLTLIARWQATSQSGDSTADTYTLTFDTNGLASVASATYSLGTVPTAPADPSVTGYTFSGWYLDAAYTTKYDFTYGFTADTTLYGLLEAEGEYAGYQTISNYTDLLKIADDPTGKYVLLNDITCRAEYWTMIEEFSGELNGNGYKIYAFDMVTEDAITGFIGTNTGIIQNLTLSNFTISVTLEGEDTDMYYSVLCCNNSGTIRNCHVENGTWTVVQSTYSSSVETWNMYLGALAAYNTGTVEDCSNAVSVDVTAKGDNQATKTTYMNSYIGGIVGYNSGNVLDCQNSGEITAYVWVGYYSTYKCTHKSFVGGLVGGNYGVLQDSFATGAISVTHDEESIEAGGYQYAQIGGALGSNYGTVRDCYATGNITRLGKGRPSLTYAYIGGFVGRNHSTVNSCYATGDISDEVKNTYYGYATGYIGGFVGYDEKVDDYTALITKCFSTGSITSTHTLDGSGYFAGKTTGSETRCYYLGTATFTVDSTATTPTAEVGEAVSASELLTVDFLENTLYYDTSVWILTDQKYPTLR